MFSTEISMPLFTFWRGVRGHVKGKIMFSVEISIPLLTCWSGIRGHITHSGHPEVRKSHFHDVGEGSDSEVRYDILWAS